MVHKPHNYWTKERCALVAKDCKHRKEFFRKYGSAYNIARTNGWLDEICSHMPMTRKQKQEYYSYFENCRIAASSFKNRNEFRSGNEVAYRVAQSNNWLDFFFDNPKSVSQGWWQDKNHCADAALKCKSRIEFYRNWKGAYLAAARNGWLDEICKPIEKYQKEHGTYKRPNGYWTKEKCLEAAKKAIERGESKQEFCKKHSAAHRSILQNDWTDEIFSLFPILGDHYNRCIYVYEFPDKSAYIGLTCNPFARNRGHNEKKTSAVYQHKKKTGLEPKMKILTDYMPNEEAQKQELQYLMLYKSNGWNILNKIKTGALGSSQVIWNRQKCEEISSRYKILKEFTDKEPLCYSAINRNGWNELLSHMQRNKLTTIQMREIALGCSTINEFRKKHRRIYDMARRHNVLEEVTNGIPEGFNGPTEKEIREIASSYNSYTKFCSEQQICIKWAKRRGIFTEITAHMEKYRRNNLTYKYLADEAKVCKSRSEFKKLDASGYAKALKEGWLNEICSHMNPQCRVLSNELLKEIALKYQTKKDFQKEDSSAYNTAKDRGILDELCIHMINQKRKPYTLDECVDVAKKYQTLNEFRNKAPQCYSAVCRNKWQEIVCKHMERIARPPLTIAICREIALDCNTRAELQRKDPSCYNAARKNGWLDEICKHMKPSQRKSV